jgi:hypothetical protein
MEREETMSHLSRLRQRQDAILHQREQAPILQQTPVQIDIASIVPMMIASGQKIQYGVDSGEMPDGQPYVRIGLQVGPIAISCPWTLDEARAFERKLGDEISKREPKPEPDETEGAERTRANLKYCRIPSGD